MELHPAVDLSRLTMKPRLLAEERTKFRILSRAYRILLSAGSAVAADVREEALKILRKRYHIEFDAMHRHQRLEQSEWIALKAYFQSRYHRTYFSTSRYGRRVNAYIRAAERTYDDVTIYGRDDDTDYAIVGWEPGRTTPSILARVYAEGTAAPNIYQICKIVDVRRSYWNSSKLALFGLALGAIFGLILEFKFRLFSGTDAQQLVTPAFCMLGFALGTGIAWLRNLYQYHKIRIAFPQLRIAF